MVVFLGTRPGQVPEEPQPEGLDSFRDWQAACSVPVVQNWTEVNISYSGNKRLRSKLVTTSLRNVWLWHVLSNYHSVLPAYNCKPPRPLNPLSRSSQRSLYLLLMTG